MNNLRNSVQLIGHLGKEVELVELDSGSQVAKFTLATNDYYKNKDGEKTQQTEWHNIVAWGKTAELMAKVLKKGNEVALNGKLTHSSYEDKDGVKRYVTEVKAREFLKITRSEEEGLPF